MARKRSEGNTTFHSLLKRYKLTFYGFEGVFKWSERKNRSIVIDLSK
jgi:hypothetical protein